jgi:hypothetical protein
MPFPPKVVIASMPAQRQDHGLSPSCCNVLELRQYTTRPGERDTLVSIFDRHFVEPQEAEGMTVIGQFRDRRCPDRFMWIRGFKARTCWSGSALWTVVSGGARWPTLLRSSWSSIPRRARYGAIPAWPDRVPA